MEDVEDFDENDELNEEKLNPIQKMQKRAVHLSGVPLKRAFAIDEGRNIGKQLPDYVITTLCETFYKKVYASDAESNGKNPAWFRDLFSNKTYEESIHDLSEFLTQRLGGLAYYSERKGILLNILM